MSSLCSHCGQQSSSSLVVPLPPSSTYWLAAAPQTCSLHQLAQNPTEGTGSPTSLHFPGLSRQVPCHPSGLSAQQRVRGTRQPSSIFRLWRIPLGSPFQTAKVSHREGEAKTHIRPTDPALTRAHRSELAGLQRLGGQEVAAGAHGEAAKGTGSRSKAQHYAALRAAVCSPTARL